MCICFTILFESHPVSTTQQAMGIQISNRLTMDPKQAAIFCLKQFPESLQSEHHFGSLQDGSRRKGWCHWHDAECSLTAFNEDFFSCGYPCSPFSQQRPGRMSDSSSWETHPQVQSFYDTLTYIDRCRPKVALLENVSGFLMHSEEEGSPLTTLDSALEAMGCYKHRSVLLDSSCFATQARKRFHTCKTPAMYMSTQGPRICHTICAGMSHNTTS